MFIWDISKFKLLLLFLLLFIYFVKQVSIYKGSEMYTDVDLRVKN